MEFNEKLVKSFKFLLKITKYKVYLVTVNANAFIMLNYYRNYLIMIT